VASYRTSLSRARGLGAAKHGVGAWIGERVTAVALVPLVIWGVFSALMLSVADYQTAALWVQKPLNAVLLVLLIATGFWHMHAGLRVVVEDYVENALGRTAVLLLNLFVCTLGAALAIFSILKVALAAGVY
jgi:succinate dehydrogenase / fumarate reductase membrane anchor subunit